jgi:hypothetical protein
LPTTAWRRSRTTASASSIPKEQYFVKYSFIPDPKGGFYDIGFGQLLESLGETIDTTINQMLDAGHLQNAGGGFIGTGIRLKKGGQIKVSPGRFEQIETTGKLSDQIHMHQFQGPSPVLFQLLGMMVEAAKDITAVKDILTGDTNGKVQTATTTLAMIEQGLKVFTAIYKRIYRALKDEFKLLFELNARTSTRRPITPSTMSRKWSRSPTTTWRRWISARWLIRRWSRTCSACACAVADADCRASRVWAIQDAQEALKRIYDAAGVQEPDKLIKKQQGPKPG